jgi:hypothetical protein
LHEGGRDDSCSLLVASRDSLVNAEPDDGRPLYATISVSIQFAAPLPVATQDLACLLPVVRRRPRPLSADNLIYLSLCSNSCAVVSSRPCPSTAWSECRSRVGRGVWSTLPSGSRGISAHREKLLPNWGGCHDGGPSVCASRHRQRGRHRARHERDCGVRLPCTVHRLRRMAITHRGQAATVPAHLSTSLALVSTPFSNWKSQSGAAIPASPHSTQGCGRPCFRHTVSAGNHFA